MDLNRLEVIVQEGQMEILTQDLQEVAPPRELLMVIHFLNRSEGLDKDAIQQDLELKH